MQVIVIVNLATFLQGASLPTSSISVPRLLEATFESVNGTSWPRDFTLSSSEGDWIARAWLLSHIAAGLVANSVAEIVGRKKSTLIDCLAFLIGYILYGVGENVATLIVARVFLGYPLINTVSIKTCFLSKT